MTQASSSVCFCVFEPDIHPTFDRQGSWFNLKSMPHLVLHVRGAPPHLHRHTHPHMLTMTNCIQDAITPPKLQSSLPHPASGPPTATVTTGFLQCRPPKHIPSVALGADMQLQRQCAGARPTPVLSMPHSLVRRDKNLSIHCSPQCRASSPSRAHRTHRSGCAGPSRCPHRCHSVA